MLKTKDKRFICLVILSVSIVSLLTALVSGFVGRMVILCSGNYTWHYMLEAGLVIAHIALGLAFALLFFLCKKRQNLVNLIMTCANAVLFVVFAVVLGIKTYSVNLTSYLTISLTIMISATFMTVTKWLLLKYDEEIEKTITENTDNE